MADYLSFCVYFDSISDDSLWGWDWFKISRFQSVFGSPLARKTVAFLPSMPPCEQTPTRTWQTTQLNVTQWMLLITCQSNRQHWWHLVWMSDYNLCEWYIKSETSELQNSWHASCPIKMLVGKCCIKCFKCLLVPDKNKETLLRQPTVRLQSHKIIRMNLSARKFGTAPRGYCLWQHLHLHLKWDLPCTVPCGFPCKLTIRWTKRWWWFTMDDIW